MLCLTNRLRWQWLSHIALALIALLLTACGSFGSSASAGTPPTPNSSPIVNPTLSPTTAGSNVCPVQLKAVATCPTPFSMREAYGMQSLIAQGMTGKGQTVVDIVSYGSPTLQQDMDAFDRQFGLPPITLQIAAPIGSVKFDPANSDMLGWAEETTQIGRASCRETV